MFRRLGELPVYTQVDPLRHCQNLSPPKSPILVDFEMKRGFRGQAIYLVQSPPILGDLGLTSVGLW